MRRAFTLIEILTVIAIVAVLAAILFPVVGLAKRRAYLSQDVQQMRQVYDAIVMYESDCDGVSPPGLTTLLPYTKSKDIFSSPVDPYRNGAPGRSDFPANPPFTDPSLDERFVDRQRSEYRVSYGYLFPVVRIFGQSERYSQLRADPKWCLLVNWFYNESMDTPLAGNDVDIIRWQKTLYRIRTDGSFSTWHRPPPASIGCGNVEDCFAPDGTDINGRY
jgi:prepilin-type N-terminal cleavage/methylation domain-containing protein